MTAVTKPPEVPCGVSVHEGGAVHLPRPPLDMERVARWLEAELRGACIKPRLLAWRADGAARFAVSANGKEGEVVLTQLEANLYADWTHQKLDGPELDPRRLVAHLQRTAREVLSRLQPEQPTTPCPKCRAVLPDFDGFGVLAHGACGYCTCPAMDGIGDGWFKCIICPKVQRHFKNTGEDFSGWHAARDWLKANGYSVGPSSNGEPAGIHKGFIAPLCRPSLLTDQQRVALDGTITWDGGDPRTADALVTLKAAPQ